MSRVKLGNLGKHFYALVHKPSSIYKDLRYALCNIALHKGLHGKIGKIEKMPGAVAAAFAATS